MKGGGQMVKKMITWREFFYGVAEVGSSSKGGGLLAVLFS